MTSGSAAGRRVRHSRQIPSRDSWKNRTVFRFDTGIVDSLARTAYVLLIESQPSRRLSPLAETGVPSLTLREVNFPTPLWPSDGSLNAGLQILVRHLMQRAALPRWEQEVLTTIRDWRPEVVITFPSYTPFDGVRLAQEFPTIVFAEEESIHTFQVEQLAMAHPLVRGPGALGAPWIYA